MWNKVKDLFKSVGDLSGAMSGKSGANAKLSDGGKAAEDMAGAVGSLADMLRPVIDALAWVETHGEWLTRLNEAAQLLNPLRAVATAIQAIKDGGDVTLPAWMVPGAAAGGFIDRRAFGGWTMVGEHGPELINNRGFVKPHSASMGGAGGGGGRGRLAGQPGVELERGQRHGVRCRAAPRGYQQPRHLVRAARHRLREGRHQRGRHDGQPCGGAAGFGPCHDERGGTADGGGEQGQGARSYGYTVHGFLPG
jgi:hypothetical protein